MTSISPRAIGAGSIASKNVDSIVGVSQLIERGDKLRLRTETARALVDAAEKDRSDVERTQRLGLSNAYYDLAYAQEKVRITAETAALFKKSLDAARLRLQAGDIAAVDASRMHVDALRADNDARASLAELKGAQTALAYMIGQEGDAARIRASDPLPAPEEQMPPPSADAVAQALAARPDVQAAGARVVAAERARELARALRTRDLTAGVQFERYPGTDPRSSVGFTVSVPLFVNHYYEGELRRAEVDWQAAQDQLERAKALAATELTKAAAELASAHERLSRYRTTLLAAAEQAAQGAEFAYGRGAIGVMDVLDARRQFAATRLDALSAQLDYVKALAAWQAARAVSSD
jgi:cobalt-zinc-cadmium efflux system outer membrane protein